jgi:hypothetical protein
MTSLPHTHIRLRDLSELIAGIPYVIGFPPTDSLVLFTFRRCPELALSTTIRVDLPQPEHVEPLVAEVTGAVVRNAAVAAIAVVIAEDGPDHRELIERLRKELDNQDVLLSHASHVSRIANGEVWQCYDGPLCHGVVPDPQSSALAAATAVAGDTTYPNREAIAAHLAPDSAEALIRREKLLDAYRMSPAQPYTDADLEADMQILGHALDKATGSYDLPSLSDHQLVRLARAMSQIPVKDECLAITLSEDSQAAERLWTVLVRALPAPERAEPAFLLAMSTYLRGAGVLAALALQIVMESNPTHNTAVLLDYALQRGLPPRVLRNMLMKSIVKNNEERSDPSPLEDDDPPWDTTPDDYGTTNTDPSTSDSAPQDRPEAEQPFPGYARCAEAARRPASESESSPGFSRGTGGQTDSSEPGGPADMPTSTQTPATTATPPPANALGGTETGASTESASSMSMVEPPRTAPGALRQQAAAALGVIGGAPVRRTMTMDALTAFLPPPTERPGPG